MNVLVVADADLQGKVSGAERVLAAHCLGLYKRGHNVHLIAGIPDGGAKASEEVQGVQVYRYQRSFGSLLGSRRLFQSLSSKISFAVLIFHQPLSAFGVTVARGNRSIPKVYVFHSPWAEEYAARGPDPKSGIAIGGRFLRRTLEHFVLRTCKRIFVLSHFMADRVVKAHPRFADRVTCLPGGVDVDRFRPAEDRQAAKASLRLPSKGPLLLTVRNLEPRMGIDHLLYAMQEVSKERSQVNLIIGGEGPLKADLEGLAKQLGLETSVRFAGYIPDERLPTYYQAADFFLVPTQALEGFGLVVVEALACGTPVLGTPVGAIPEILNELQPDLLFEGIGPEAIAGGILEHLDRAQADPQGYENLRQRCRDYGTARFGWDRIVERLEQELLNLTGCDEQGKG
ncbi:MAG: glycosyltransferase family 4 protein [Candidatus Methylomirabilales bacterium]